MKVVRDWVRMRLSLFLSRTWLLSRPWPLGLLLALASVTASTLAGLAVQAHFNVYTLAKLYLLAVLVSALLAGISGGLMTAFCAFLAYNYFFIPPTFTLFIANPDDFFALFMFLLTALVTGGLAGKVREQYHLAELHSEWMQSLVALTGQLAAASSQSDIVAVISRELAARWAVGHHIVTLTPEGECCVRAWPEGEVLPEPLAPRMIQCSPGRTVQWTSRRMWVSPRRMESWRTWKRIFGFIACGCSAAGPPKRKPPNEWSKS